MNIQADVLQTIQGVGPSIAQSLANRYETWAALADAERSSLEAMPGLRKSAITPILDMAALRAADEDGVATAPVVTSVPKVTEPDDAKWVLREERVDRFTIKRSRVKLTPAVCAECGLDLVDSWGLSGWDDLSQKEREDLRKALAVHMSVEHSPINQRVLSDADMRELTKGRKAVGLEM